MKELQNHKTEILEKRLEFSNLELLKELEWPERLN